MEESQSETAVSSLVELKDFVENLEEQFSHDRQNPQAGKPKLISELLKDKNRSSVVDTQVIVHGLYKSQEFRISSPVRDVWYNRVTRCFYAFDGKSVHKIIQNDELEESASLPSVSFEKLLFAEHVSMFIGWTPDSQQLLLLNDQFDVRCTCTAPGPVLALAYNQSAGEIIASGAGFISSWMFRYGGRSLLVRRITVEGLSSSTDIFNLLAIEDISNANQKVYAVNDKAVAVFNVLTGELLSYRKSLHSQSITALLLNEPLQYFITAAMDGTIKVWDSDWRVQLILTGHVGCVTTLSVHPSSALCFLSAGLDCTVRVWSLETCDQRDIVAADSEISELFSIVNVDTVAMLATEGVLSLWKLNSIYKHHTRIGYQTKEMHCSIRSQGPTRCVAACEDSSVRIISADYGDVLTTLLMPSQRGLVSAAYSQSEEIIFAVFSDGSIVKADSSTNPCTIINDWPLSQDSSSAKHLLIYEYSTSLDDESMEVVVQGVAETRAMTSLVKDLPGGIAKGSRHVAGAGGPERILLFGGCADGSVCVYNWSTGKVDLTIAAHDRHPVCGMISNKADDQLITAGLDNSIRIWRVFPFARETLAPIMSLCCAQNPARLAIIKTRLFVAFQEESSATNSIVVYNLKTQGRNDHGPTCDHTDKVAALTSCPHMKLVASSSLDGTIRIWNTRNELIRVIKLSDVATSLCFSSVRGDLLVSIGRDIYRIDCMQYLPQSYKIEICETAFEPIPRERPVGYSDERLCNLTQEDVDRLKGATAAVKFTTRTASTIADSENLKNFEIDDRQEVYRLLEAREREIKELRDGLIHPLKPFTTSTSATRAEAFEKYLKFFYDRPKHSDIEDEENITEERDSSRKQTQPKYSPFREVKPSGFFPPPTRTYYRRGVASCDSATEYSDVSFPPRPCVIPNSVLVRLLFPLKPASLIEQDKCKEFDRMRELVLLSQRLETENEAEEEDNLSSSDNSSTQEQKGEEAERLRRIHAMLMKGETKNGDDGDDSESVGKGQVGDGADSGSHRITTSLQSSDAERSAQASRVKQELMRRQKETTSGKFFRREEIRAGRERSELGTLAEDVGWDLPDYISRFIGRPWMENLFPNAHLDAKTLSLSAWTASIARMLRRTTDHPTRAALIEALQQIQVAYGISDSELVCAAVYDTLADRTLGASAYESAQGRQFLQGALKLFHVLGCSDAQFYATLMVSYIEGDAVVRNQVMEILKSNGLRDSGGALPKEILSLDSAGVKLEDGQRIADLLDRCKAWLEKWRGLFMVRLKDSIDRLKQGQNVQSQLRGRATQTKFQKERKPRQLSVKVDIEAVAQENATCVESINYFCETELERSMVGRRNRRTGNIDAFEFQDGFSFGNTILSKPGRGGKASLMRLGESHASGLTRRSRTCPELKLPPLSQMKFPLRTYTMNPFPRPEDDFDPFYTKGGDEAFQITLTNSKKYFVLAQSYCNAN